MQYAKAVYSPASNFVLKVHSQGPVVVFMQQRLIKGWQITGKLMC